MKGTWRVVAGLLVFWLVVLVYMSTTLYTSSDVNERTERQLSKALQELDNLKRQNSELHNLANELKDMRKLASKGENVLIQELQRRLDEANKKLEKLAKRTTSTRGATDKQGPMGVLKDGEPDFQHEYLRRKIDNGVTEFWYYMSAQLKQLKKKSAAGDSVLVSQITNILREGADQGRSILTDLYNLSESNGAGDWRRQEAKELSDIIQKRLQYLQNPKDCSTAKKLVCNLNKGCGYGCQLHHLVYCFIIAYGTKRTLILESRGWRYSPGGWEKVFQPLSKSCTDRGGKSSRSWGPPHIIDKVQVIELPIVDSLHPRPPFMPLAIPEDLAPRLMKLHGHPVVWWIGQFLKYLLRPQPSFARTIAETKARLKFKNPIVGVHVRRTDKVGTEAAFHSIDEYMYHVSQWFALYERRKHVDRRRVYLATDDPNLLAEARRKYPDYDFVSDNDFAKAAGLGSRYTDRSLRGIILDIHFLSNTDYLVCTFSSQVCRVAYEIMQTMHTDASTWFHSLDDIYYYGGQNAHNQVAVLPHHAQSGQEIELLPGDVIGVAGNHWDGYSKGYNRRIGRTGLYPSYKVQDKTDIAKFPTYKEVNEFR